MNTKLLARVCITVAVVGMIVCLVSGIQAIISLSRKQHQESVQNYRNDFEEVKIGGKDVLAEYSKIRGLHTAIKYGFVRSAEIGTSNLEVALQYELSKDRARKELENRVKNYPPDSESYKSYSWLLKNLDQ